MNRGKTTPESTPGSYAPHSGARSRVAPADDGTVRLIAAGLSADDAAVALAAGLDVEQFVEHSIRNGITLAEAMEAQTKWGDIGYYNYIREEAGCGHTEVMAAFADSDGEDDFEAWAADFNDAKQQRQFNPALTFGEVARAPRIYQVEPGTEVFLESGLFPSNTYIGSSQAYGRVFRRHRMGADDRIVENAGGRWVATADGRVFKARFHPEAKHLFERGGSADPAPAVGYRCESHPFAEMGVRQEPASLTSEAVYGTMVRFGAMDYVENTGPGL